MAYKYKTPTRWHDCRRTLSGKNAFTINGCQIPCSSKKCKSQHCIRARTSKESKIRMVNYYFLKPDFFVVLRIENISFQLNSWQTAKFLKRFKKKLKDFLKSINYKILYEFIIEFDVYKRPHFHMIIKDLMDKSEQKTEIEVKGILDELWGKSIKDLEQNENLCGLNGSVYCQKIRSLHNSAIYLSKAWDFLPEHNPVPEDWNISECHIVSRSKGFFVSTQKELLQIYKENKHFFWQAEKQNIQQGKQSPNQTKHLGEKIAQKNTRFKKAFMYASWTLALVTALMFAIKYFKAPNNQIPLKESSLNQTHNSSRHWFQNLFNDYPQTE